ncbi:MAG: DUF1223 domain-containing protein [Hyphomicrobiales bacterium]|nr:MAG: DUF1223 domain-containing protein [Hyphomicrobiales bacterium]
MVVVGCCNLGAGPFSSRTIDYVAELFTSQGCSSCPPADQWLTSIARAPGVVAVSFHVDYWDYIGWRDTLASPAFTARQKAYAAAHGEGNVYTPQAIVNGLAGAAGGDSTEIEQAIKAIKELDGALTVRMRLSETSGHFAVEVAEGGGGPAGVFALRVARASTVQILRGENAGRSVTYTNVVRAIDKLGDWTGRTATFDMPDAAHEGEGFVVLVQKGTPEQPGAILAAAKTEGL